MPDKDKPADREYRTAYGALTVRAASDTTPPGYEGFASTFWTVDSYGTAFAKGAFEKTLAERGERLPVLWNHDPDQPIGRHLDIKERRATDGHPGGLYVNVALSSVPRGEQTLQLLRDGVPLGLSFAFRTMQDRAPTPAEAEKIDTSQMPDLDPKESRLITEVKLYETSPVTFPANDRAALLTVRQIVQSSLPLLLSAIRAGELTDEQLALVADIVAADEARRAGAGAGHSTPPDITPRRDLLLALTAAKAQWGHHLERIA